MAALRIRGWWRIFHQAGIAAAGHRIVDIARLAGQRRIAGADNRVLGARCSPSSLVSNSGSGGAIGLVALSSSSSLSSMTVLIAEVAVAERIVDDQVDPLDR